MSVAIRPQDLGRNVLPQKTTGVINTHLLVVLRMNYQHGTGKLLGYRNGIEGIDGAAQDLFRMRDQGLPNRNRQFKMSSEAIEDSLYLARCRDKHQLPRNESCHIRKNVAGSRHHGCSTERMANHAVEGPKMTLSSGNCLGRDAHVQQTAGRAPVPRKVDQDDFGAALMDTCGEAGKKFRP